MTTFKTQITAKQSDLPKAPKYEESLKGKVLIEQADYKGSRIAKAKDPNDPNSKDLIIHEFQEQDELKVLWGTAELDNKLKQLKDMGEVLVTITYNGKVKKKSKKGVYQAHDFTVEVEEVE